LDKKHLREKNGVLFQKNESLILCAFLALILAHHTFGYIDMNAGSYILQIAIAGIFGALYAIRGYLKSAKLKLQNLINTIARKKKPKRCK